MESFDKQLCEYRKQLEKGTIKTAYQELMRYFDSLRLHLKNKHPDYFISDVHYGLMDYTYFYFFPKQLQCQKLKIVILFTHETFKFEILLAGYNRSAQEKYWRLFKENGFNKYRLTSNASEPDRFIDSILVEKPDFSNLDALSSQIEVGTLKFIKDIQDFLTKHQKP